MEIRNLASCPLEVIVQATLESFADYPLEFPSDVDYFRHSFAKARVDFRYSWGAFHEGRLVGTAINGLDVRGVEQVVYSKSVGVVPEFRGRGLVDQLYAAMWPGLRALGVEKCQLEVIPENARAIRVYERIGFVEGRRWQAFKGRLDLAGLPEVRVDEADFGVVNARFPSEGTDWPWDCMDKGILAAAAAYKTYLVEDGQGNGCGYFTVRTERGTVTRFVFAEGKLEWLLAGVGKVLAEPEIVCLDAGNDFVIGNLKEKGFKMAWEDIEMEMKI